MSYDPIPDHTCPCGLYTNPAHPAFNAKAIHISDCPYQSRWIGVTATNLTDTRVDVSDPDVVESN